MTGVKGGDSNSIPVSEIPLEERRRQQEMSQRTNIILPLTSDGLPLQSHQIDWQNLPAVEKRGVLRRPMHSNLTTWNGSLPVKEWTSDDKNVCYVPPNQSFNDREVYGRQQQLHNE